MMHYIKLGLWIFVLSVLYASGIFEISVFYPELLFLFSVLYSIWAKSFKERITVTVISGIFMGALSGYGFLFSLLLVLYSSFIFFGIFSGRLKKYKPLMILTVFIMTALYEIIFGLFFENTSYELLYTSCFQAITNCVFVIILYPLIKRTFEKKERYIF